MLDTHETILTVMYLPIEVAHKSPIGYLNSAAHRFKKNWKKACK